MLGMRGRKGEKRKQKATDRKIKGNSKQMFPQKSSLSIMPWVRNHVIFTGHLYFIGSDSEANVGRSEMISDSKVQTDEI